MELYEHNDDPYVQIFYRNTTETNIKPLEVPNCGTKCPLSKIYDLYDDILPTGSFDEESSLRDGESTPSAYYKVLNIPWIWPPVFFSNVISDVTYRASIFYWWKLSSVENVKLKYKNK